MYKVFGKYAVLGFALMMAVVFLSSGMSGSAEAVSWEPIVIDMDHDLDYQADLYGWPGTGTAEDPYIIDNLDIDASGYVNAIFLFYTQKHVVISNCVLYGASDSGIALHYVSNVTILGNYIHSNGHNGVYLYSSSNVTLQGNDCVGNTDDGIRAVSTSNIAVSGNTCEDSYDGMYLGAVDNSTFGQNQLLLNGARGFFVVGSDNNTFHDNFIDDYALNGFYLDGSHFNLINGTECEYLNGDPIYLYESNWNRVTNSTLVGTEYGAGVYLWRSNGNLISNNQIVDSTRFMTQYGICLDVANDNLVMNNTLNGTYVGVQLSTSDGNVIENNTCTNPAAVILGTGIELGDSHGNMVVGNRVNNTYAGISLSSSNLNSLIDNSCQDVDGDGISVYDSNYNTIANNLCANNSVNGIAVYSSEASSHDNTITNNTCFQNGDVLDGAGIYLASSPTYSSTGNTISYNDCDSNNFYGIWIYNSPNNVIVSNVVHNSIGSGIYLSTSSVNQVTANDIHGNGDSGIWLDSSDHCLVQGNTGELNTDGVYLSYSDLNELSGNDFDGNTFGFFLYLSSGNSITENNCTGGEFGMYVTGDCQLNVIDNNTCTGSIYAGILLDGSANNSILNNTCSGNVGIAIESSANSTVSNNTCTENYDGISISNSPGSLIVNNTCTGNYDGIVIFQSSNCTIAGNVCDNNTYGILLTSDSDHNVLFENTCNNNALQGISVGYSDGNLLSNNMCNLNGDHGIVIGSTNNSVINSTCQDNGKNGILLENARYSLLNLNTCTGNAVGIRLEGSTNNTISGNAISGNGINGLVLYGSDNNGVLNNTVVNNVEEGIFLSSSTLNAISGNVLRGNNGATSEYDASHIQAFDDGLNYWNNTSNGNFWDDWTSPDMDGNGIVDEPYIIQGGSGVDNYPLAVCLTIITPAEGAATDESTIGLSGTAVSYFGVVQVTWYNTATGEFGVCTGTDSWTATVALTEGANLIMVNMTDLSEIEKSDTVSVVLDTTPPSLVITSPTDGAYVGSSVTVNWAGNDAGTGVSYYTVSIEGMFFINTTNSSCPITGLADGTYTVLVSAYDALDNCKDEVVTFTVDVNDPSVTISSPGDGLINTTGSITMTWTGSDAGSGVDRYEVSWEGGSPVTLLPSDSTYTFTGLSDGSHVLTVAVYDNYGRSSSDTVTVMVDTQAPSLTITNPAEGGYVANGDITVTWSGSDAGTGVEYYTVSIEGLFFLNTTGSSCDINGLADGTYTVLVSAYDQLGNCRDVTATFTVDTAAPTLVIDSPEDGQLFNASAVTVSWTTSDTNPGTVQIRFDGDPYAIVHEQQIEKLALTNGLHAVHVKVTDAAGNFIEASVNFTVDTDAPTVAFTSPVEGSLVNSAQGTVEWEASDATSGLNGTFIRVDGGEWTQLGAVAIWAYELEDGQHTIEVMVTDMAGNSANATLNITVDTAAPEAEVSPIGDELELDLVILVEFSERMNQTSVSIAVPGVTGTLEWEGNAMMFTPFALYYNQEYAVQVTGKDLAGNQMEVNWTFTTRSVGNLTGVIVDENGDPVANVTVTSGEFTAVTDEDGRFMFLNLSVGTYQFEVDAEGYEPFTFNATVEQGVTVDEGMVEMVPEETEGEGDGDGGSIWLYVIIVIAVLVVGVVAFVFLRKK